MFVLNGAALVNNQQRRHPAEFRQFHLLLINVGDSMPGIRQANEGQFFGFPVSLEST
jgi:hypothetical protein